MCNLLRGLGVAGIGFILSGCGLYQVRSEAGYYHEELETQAIAAFADCRAGKKTSMTQNRNDGPPDCFDLVVKQSPQRIGVKRDTAQLRDGDKQLPATARDAYAYIDQFALMALFSKMVYHRYENVGDRNSETTCRANSDKHPLNSLYDEASTGGRWRLWENGDKGCYARDGLYFETYVYYPAGASNGNGRFTKAVIVFRGTENHQSERMADWTSNLASAFGIRPGQYVAAVEQLDGVIAALRDGGSPDLDIYSAGHSLGGGLAQMAAYWSKHVKAAYVFNSTPVTGWTWIHRQHRTANTLDRMNADPTIYRIAQRTEALSALRAVSTAVNSERFGRADYDFDFRLLEKKENPGRFRQLAQAASQHDIGLLACHMAARVVLAHADSGGKAAFDYSAQMALRALQQKDQLVGADRGNEQVCTNNNLQEIWNAVCSTPDPLAPLCTSVPRYTAQ